MTASDDTISDDDYWPMRHAVWRQLDWHERSRGRWSLLYSVATRAYLIVFGHVADHASLAQAAFLMMRHHEQKVDDYKKLSERLGEAEARRELAELDALIDQRVANGPEQ